MATTVNKAISSLTFIQIMAPYNPTQEIIILIGDGQIKIYLREGLAITPAVCYDKLRQSCDKFPLDETI
ncbi:MULTISPECIES: hypothetical protein [unclassified Microcoleus]|uniref:hypothetical protein n=1 Tax=unclassified Microcoleus TaxID=2642155 RepID=UPI002FD09391